MLSPDRSTPVTNVVGFIPEFIYQLLEVSIRLDCDFPIWLTDIDPSISLS